MNEGQKKIIRWLHLSDFHVGKDDYGQRRLFEEILEHVRLQKAEGFVLDFIFITGDVADKGKSAQYKVFVSDFLLPLYEIVGNKIESNTFIVPGNHDVFRETHEFFEREDICNTKSVFFDPTKPGLKKRQNSLLPRFNDYIKSPFLKPRNWINQPEGCYSERVDIRGMMVGVLGINTAWLSKDDEDRNKLSPGINLLQGGFQKLQGCNIKIVLGHHPIGWFRQDHISQIRSIFEKNNALYLHGHVHKEDVYMEGYGSLCIQSGAAFITRDDDKLVNGLMWAKLDLSRKVLSVQPRQWNPKHLDWPMGRLPEKRRIPEGIWWEYQLPYSESPLKHVIIPSESPEGIQPVYQEQTGFVGRNREIKEFKQFLKSKDEILNFHGISGIGKSWLLDRLLKDLMVERIISGCKVVKVDCKEISGDLSEIMHLIAHGIGEKQLPRYILIRNKYSENTPSDPFLYKKNVVDDMWNMLFLDLQTISKTKLLVIFIDSFEKVQGTIVGDSIRIALKNNFDSRSNDGLKVVIGSQECINSSKDWARLRDVEIKPFSREELAEFAENNLGTSDNTVINYLADVWMGDPLELGQLVNRFRKDQGTKLHILAQLRSLRSDCVAATDGMSLKGLRERLGDEDIGIISYCAVPRWFDASVIRAIDGSDIATSQALIKRLSQWWFVKQRTRGGYEIHERYRIPLLRSLIQDDRDMFSKWSKHCYEYLQSNVSNLEGSRDISREIESVYHLMVFNAKDALLQYNNLRYSFGQGKRLDLMVALQDTVQQHINIHPQIDDIFKYWIDYGRAIISYQCGNESKAILQSYERLLTSLHSNVDGFRFLRGRVFRAKGDLLHWKEKNKPEAIKCFEEAIRLWKEVLQENVVPFGITKDDIAASIAQTHVAIARIEEINGSLLEGMKHLNSALEAYSLCETIGPSYGETLRMMARNLRLQGKWDEAHQRFNEAEVAFNIILKNAIESASLSKRVEETQTRLQEVQNARAALWKEEGKWKQAQEVLKQVIAFHKNKAETTRNQETLGIAQIDFGDVLRMEGDFIQAKQVYKKAQQSLRKSIVNKGYPLLGLAEVAMAEGKDEDALKYLSKAEKAFLAFNYTRKLSEVALCRVKLARKENISEALSILVKTWEMIRETNNTYAKSAVLVELTGLVFEIERDSKRYKNYRMQAMKMAGQEQRLFAEHLAKLNFIDGRIAGEKNPVNALPAFIKAMAWATRHNCVTLQRMFSQAVAWRDARLDIGTEIVRGRKVETLAREAEAAVWQSKEIALSTLSEEAQIAFKGVTKKLECLFESFAK
jgi:tetratricopeptide (TPR) repeat protein